MSEAAMSFDIHIHFPKGSSPTALSTFINQLRKTLMNQAELATALGGVSTQLSDVGTQMDKAMTELVVALSQAGLTSPEVDLQVAALQTLATSLKAASQALDDLNQDSAPAA